MKHIEYNWADTDGQNVYAQGWEPSSAPKGVICLVHGMFEHSGRYKHVADFYTKKGFALLAIDLKGHGKTEGQKGHIKNYDVLLNQIDQLLEKANTLYPSAPKFLYGHSMGGGLVTHYTILRSPDVKGSIATGPWIELAFKPPSFKLALGKMMVKLYPGYTEKSDLDVNDLSHDPSVGEAYLADPMVHDKISSGFFFGVHNGGIWSKENIKKIKKPLLLCHGGEDKVTSWAATEKLALDGGDLVTFKKWDKLRHEIHNEPKQKEVLSYINDWMDKLLEH